MSVPKYPTPERTMATTAPPINICDVVFQFFFSLLTPFNHPLKRAIYQQDWYNTVVAKNTLSVIIPTLNEEKCLPVLLSNLAKQSYKDFEVIVIDGNSTDKTEAKADLFSKRLNIRFFKVDKRNVSYQRNFGARMSTANILVFLDADTIIPSNFFKKVSETFKGKGPDLLTTYIKTDEKGIKPIEVGSNIIFELTRIIGSPALYGSMVAVKKKAFESVNGFDEKIGYKEDTKLAQDIYKKGYKYLVLRDTYYYWSLRRFKKLGTVKTLQKYFLLNLGKTLDYQMGGHLFIEEAINKLKTSKTKEIEVKFEEFVDRLIEKFKLN